MENNKQKIAVIALVALLVVGAVGATIAYFTSETVFKNEFKTPAHESEFTEEFSSPENWLPGDEEKKEVSVKNTGEYDIAVRISYTEEWIGADGTTQLPLIQDQDGTEVRAAIINFPNKDDWGKRTEEDGVDYYYYKDILGKDESTSLFMDKVTFNKDIKHDEVCTNVYTYRDGTTSTGTAPEEGKIVTSTTKRCESTGQTYAGGTYILTIKIETIQWDQYKNGWGLDEDLEDLEWEKTLNSVMEKTAVLDNIKSEFVEAETGIDFSKNADQAFRNGKGLYIRAGTENDIYPIYYYRGVVKDNNVLFAGFCWKAIRTTETGGVKLIYNGVPGDNNTCDNTYDTSQITISSYGGGNITKYIGYTYDDNQPSAIKTVIDSWYEDYIENDSKNTHYGKYLEDTVWCNDRSISSTVGNSIYYGPYGRYTSASPSLQCPKEDSYTVSEVNGNGLLDYPIALITLDELIFAGLGNYSHYLNNGGRYWTMSPYSFNGYYSSMFNVSFGGVEGGSNPTTIRYAVRPCISLKNGVNILSGDGTVNKPYIMESDL